MWCINMFDIEIVLGFSSKINGNMKNLLRLLKVLFVLQVFTGCFESKNVNVKTVSSCNEEYLQLKLENLKKEFEEEMLNPALRKKEMEEDIDDFFDKFPPKLLRVKADVFDKFEKMKSISTTKYKFEEEYNKFLESFNKSEKRWNDIMNLINRMKSKISLMKKPVEDLSNKIEAINVELEKIKNSMEIDRVKFVTVGGVKSSKKLEIEEHISELDTEINKSVDKINSLTDEYDYLLNEMENKINRDMGDKIGDEKESLKGVPYKDSKDQIIKEGGYMTELVTRLKEFRNGGYDTDGSIADDILIERDAVAKTAAAKARLSTANADLDKANIDMAVAGAMGDVAAWNTANTAAIVATADIDAANTIYLAEYARVSGKNEIAGRAHDGSDSLANLIETDAKMKNRDESNAALNQVTKTLDTLIMTSEQKLYEIDRKIDAADIEFDKPNDGYLAKYKDAAVKFEQDVDFYLQAGLTTKTTSYGNTIYNGAVAKEFEEVRRSIEDTGKTTFDSEFKKLLDSWERDVKSVMAGDSAYSITDQDIEFNSKISIYENEFNALAELNNKISMSLRHLVEKSVHLGDNKLRETMNNIIRLIDESAQQIREKEGIRDILCLEPAAWTARATQIAPPPPEIEMSIINDGSIEDVNFYKIAEKAKLESDEKKVRDNCKKRVDEIEADLLKRNSELTDLNNNLTIAESDIVALPSKITIDKDILKNLSNDLVTKNASLTTKKEELDIKQAEKSDKQAELSTKTLPAEIAALNAEISIINTEISTLNGDITPLEADISVDNVKITDLKKSISDDTNKLNIANKVKSKNPDLIKKTEAKIEKLNKELGVAKAALDKAQAKFNFRIAIENSLRDKKIKHQDIILEKFKGAKSGFNGMLGAKIHTLKETLIFANNERKKNALKHGCTLDTTKFEDDYILNIDKYLKEKSTNLTFGSLEGDFPTNSIDLSKLKSGGVPAPTNDFSVTAAPAKMLEFANKGLNEKNFKKGNYIGKLKYEKSILDRKKADYESWRSELKLFKVQQNENPKDLENGLYIDIDYETWRQQEGIGTKDEKDYVPVEGVDMNTTFDEKAGHLTGINSITIKTAPSNSKSLPNDHPKKQPKVIKRLFDSTIIKDSKFKIGNEFLDKHYHYEFCYNHPGLSSQYGEIVRTQNPPQMYAPGFSLFEVPDPKIGIDVEAY